MPSLGHVCIGVAGHRRHPKKAVVRCATARRSSPMLRASAWLHANPAPRRPHFRHQALPGPAAAKEKACAQRTSQRLARSRGAFRILPPGSGRRRAWLELCVVALNACIKAIRNRRCVEAGRRRCERSSWSAGGGPDGSESAAPLGVWMTAHFESPLVVGVDGLARRDSDRSRR